MSSRGRAEATHLRLVVPDESPDSSHDDRPQRARPPAMDDAQLVAALRQGDPTAAAPFYDRARPVVDRAIYRVMGRRDRDHDDLAQIAMVQLIQSIERFRGDCALDGWIATVTAHTVYNHLRRRKTEQRIFGGEIPESSASHSAAPDRQSQMRSAVTRIRAHLDALESNKAWTFLLHAVCGYDLKEIAEITEVSVAAAQGRLSRGRRELLARLREDAELVELLEEMGTEVPR